jgi:hypothetical protein
MKKPRRSSKKLDEPPELNLRKVSRAAREGNADELARAIQEQVDLGHTRDALLPAQHTQHVLRRGVFCRVAWACMRARVCVCVRLCAVPVWLLCLCGSVCVALCVCVSVALSEPLSVCLRV